MADAEMPAARRSQGGVATMLAVGWIAFLSTAGVVAALAAAVGAAQHRVEAAADLASLAAAQAGETGQGDACGRASQVAGANAAEVSECRREGDDVVVTVAAELALPWGLDRRLSATSRAGP